jgi:hypothetical protein
MNAVSRVAAEPAHTPGATRTEIVRVVARDFRNLRSVDVQLPPEGAVAEARAEYSTD